MCQKTLKVKNPIIYKLLVSKRWEQGRVRPHADNHKSVQCIYVLYELCLEEREIKIITTMSFDDFHTSEILWTKSRIK